MKKILLILVLSVMTNVLTAQDKYFSKTGHIWFYGKTPLETIDAHNNQVGTIINTKSGSIAFEMTMKSFKFEKALMEEHFNENYVHSGKFPKCTFTGQILNFDPKMFTKDGIYNVTIEGELKLHGVSKKIKEEGTIEVKDGKFYAKAKFQVRPEDFDIQIPGVVRDKIPSKMDVNVDIVYVPYK